MAKYSYEFKKQLVSEYLDNQGSYASISQKHGMLDSCQLRKWVCWIYVEWNGGRKKYRQGGQVDYLTG